MDWKDTVILYFSPRNIPFTNKSILDLQYDVLMLKYLPHDIAFKVAKKFVESRGYDYVVITTDDVIVYYDNVIMMEEAHEVLGDKVISALMPLGMGLAGNNIWFSVTEKVLTRRPMTYRDYDLWDIRKVIAKAREKRFHKIFYTGFGFTLVPSKIFEVLSFRPMARLPARVFGRIIRKTMQIDVATSMELHEMGVEHYVDVYNVVHHLGNLRDLLPRGKVSHKVIFCPAGKLCEDVTAEFPIEEWLKEITITAPTSHSRDVRVRLRPSRSIK